MKMKRKIGKKLPVSKAIEGKVPVAWGEKEAILDIPYTTSNQVEDFDASVKNKRNYKVEYKISEEEADVWETKNNFRTRKSKNSIFEYKRM